MFTQVHQELVEAMESQEAFQKKIPPILKDIRTGSQLNIKAVIDIATNVLQDPKLSQGSKMQALKMIKCSMDTGQYDFFVETAQSTILALLERSALASPIHVQEYSPFHKYLFDCIRLWGEKFHIARSPLSRYHLLYRSLKKKGIWFPSQYFLLSLEEVNDFLALSLPESAIETLPRDRSFERPFSASPSRTMAQSPATARDNRSPQSPGRKSSKREYLGIWSPQRERRSPSQDSLESTHSSQFVPSVQSAVDRPTERLLPAFTVNERKDGEPQNEIPLMRTPRRMSESQKEEHPVRGRPRSANDKFHNPFEGERKRGDYNRGDGPPSRSDEKPKSKGYDHYKTKFNQPMHNPNHLSTVNEQDSIDVTSLLETDKDKSLSAILNSARGNNNNPINSKPVVNDPQHKGRGGSESPSSNKVKAKKDKDGKLKLVEPPYSRDSSPGSDRRSGSPIIGYRHPQPDNIRKPDTLQTDPNQSPIKDFSNPFYSPDKSLIKLDDVLGNLPKDIRGSHNFNTTGDEDEHRKQFGSNKNPTSAPINRQGGRSFNVQGENPFTGQPQEIEHESKLPPELRDKLQKQKDQEESRLRRANDLKPNDMPNVIKNIVDNDTATPYTSTGSKMRDDFDPVRFTFDKGHPEGLNAFQSERGDGFRSPPQELADSVMYLKEPENGGGNSTAKKGGNPQQNNYLNENKTEQSYDPPFDFSNDVDMSRRIKELEDTIKKQNEKLNQLVVENRGLKEENIQNKAHIMSHSNLGASMEQHMSSNLELVLSQNKELREVNDKLRTQLSARERPDSSFQYPTTAKGSPAKERTQKSELIDEISGISPRYNLKTSGMSVEDISLRKNLDQITNENLDLKKQLNVVRDELANQRERAIDLEDRIKKGDNERSSIELRETEVEKLRRENRTLILQSNDLIAQLESEKASNKRLMDEMAFKDEDLTKFYRKEAQSHEFLTEQNKILFEQNKKLAESNKEMNLMLDQERSKYKADLESKARIIEMMGKNNDDNSQKVNDLIEERDAAKRETKAAQLKVKEYEQEMKFKDDRIRELKQFHDNSRKHNENLDKLLEEEIRKTDNIKDEIVRKDQELNFKDEEIARLQRNVDDLQKDLHKSRIHQTGIEAEIANIKDLSDKLAERDRSHRIEIQDIEEKYEVEIDQLKNQNNLLQEQLNSLQEKLYKEIENGKSMSSKFGQSEKEYHQLVKNREKHLNGKLEQLQLENKELKERLNDKQEQLMDEIKRSSETQKELARLEDEIKENGEYKKTMEENYHNDGKRSNQREQELTDMLRIRNNELYNAENKIRELEDLLQGQRLSTEQPTRGQYNSHEPDSKLMRSTNGSFPSNERPNPQLILKTEKVKPSPHGQTPLAQRQQQPLSTISTNRDTPRTLNQRHQSAPRLRNSNIRPSTRNYNFDDELMTPSNIRRALENEAPFQNGSTEVTQMRKTLQNYGSPIQLQTDIKPFQIQKTIPRAVKPMYQLDLQPTNLQNSFSFARAESARNPFYRGYDSIDGDHTQTQNFKDACLKERSTLFEDDWFKIEATSELEIESKTGEHIVSLIIIYKNKTDVTMEDFTVNYKQIEGFILNKIDIPSQNYIKGFQQLCHPLSVKMSGDIQEIGTLQTQFKIHKQPKTLKIKIPVVINKFAYYKRESYNDFLERRKSFIAKNPNNIIDSLKIRVHDDRYLALKEHLLPRLIQIPTDGKKGDRFQLYGSIFTIDQHHAEFYMRLIIEKDTKITLFQVTYPRGYKNYAERFVDIMSFIVNDSALV